MIWSQAFDKKLIQKNWFYLSFDEFRHEILVESPAVVDGDQEEDETARHAQEQQHRPGHHARALQGGLRTGAGN